MPSLDPSLTALVLAGGQSLRMGQDKALIPVNGVPLLQQVCQVALQCTPWVYVVTPWPQKYQALVGETCQFIPETRSPHDLTSLGPLVGFAQGLAQVKTDWVLLLACDLPLLDATELQSWTQDLGAVPDSAIAFLPRHAKGWEPLCGFYRRSCLPLLTDFIQDGGRSFQRWLSQHPVAELVPYNRQILFNCNTPDDISAAEQTHKFQ